MTGPPPRSASPWGAPIHRLRATTSTMDEAARLIAASPPHGTAITADRQTAGRGRAPGSRWRSAAGANLLLTVMLRRADTAAAPATVPLRTGCALAEVAAALGLTPSIKWPNDVLVGGRKLAGVLCAATGGWLLVGVGVNCNQRSFPPDAGAATSLAVCLGRSVDRARVERDVLAAMHRLLRAGDWLARLRGRLAGVGRPAQVEQDGRAVAGVVLGVDGDGALRLRTAGGAAVSVLSGRLTLGPAPSGAAAENFARGCWRWRQESLS